MRKKLAWRFVLQLLTAAVAALIILIGCLFWMMQQLYYIDISNSFANAGLDKLVERSTFHNGYIEFSEELLAQVDHNNGWLQTLDETGRVQQSYHTPNDVPKQYAPGELIDYWQSNKPFPYELMVWIQEYKGEQYTILYGFKSATRKIWSYLEDQPVTLKDNQYTIPSKAEQLVEQEQGFIQILNDAGEELTSWNKPAEIKTNYSFQDLALRNIFSKSHPYYFETQYSTASGNTILVAFPNMKGSHLDEPAMFSAEIRLFTTIAIVMLVSLLIIFIAISLWYAHRFGMPMLHMLTWLNQLSKGVYEEPIDRKGRSYSKLKNGRYKQRFRIFADMLQSMEHLTKTLRSDASMRLENKRLREEWIAGITHDLKTPLSTIKGYAHMIATPQYDWSTVETKQFAQLMLDKSAHMDRLINDLTLLYRQKAGISMPMPTSEPYDLLQWLTTTLQQTFVDKNKEQLQLLFPEQPIYVTLYKPWLERIIINLASNAYTHNPAETKLTITLQLEQQVSEQKLLLSFTDNGSGLDEQTKLRLFERYFRGTNTNETTVGSGLGMAISKELTEALNGTIDVLSTTEEGTIVELSWSIPGI
ncbi:sensor histidine kinase [Paenibacillus yanchengensis]|uniref:histidine kinase n=1 Tax=Paenibacillus yanchengensis TaxID=2035833 RepID=A0ABW4YRH5_9BACL